MKSVLILIAVVFMALTLGASAASATLISTTFGPGDSYSGSAWLIGSFSAVPPFPDQSVAAVFTPTADINFDSVRVATTYGGLGSVYRVTLAADSGGLPGAAIETFEGVTFLGGIVTIASVTNPLLLGGTTYWLTMEAPTLGTGTSWFINDQGISGGVFRSSMAPSWTPLSGNAPAFEVNGSDSGVPEPATGAVVLVAFAALAWLRRKTSARV